MTGSEWANVVSVANQGALSWYGTLSGKPISSGQPNSLMRDVIGTDLGTGPVSQLSSVPVVVVVAIAAIAAVLIFKK